MDTNAIVEGLDAIDKSIRQLAQNQQAIYDAVQTSTQELTAQNELLKLQLALITDQNKLLLEILRQPLPSRTGDVIKNAEATLNRITAAATPLDTNYSDLFKT